MICRRKRTVPASELSHFEEAELKTDVQRRLPVHFWEIFLSNIVIPVTWSGFSDPDH